MWKLPAEWEQHAATWMAWPCRLEIWPDYAATCNTFAEVIRAISEFEPVKLLVNPEHEKVAKDLCGSHAIEYIPVKMDDSWARDTSPIFVTNDSQIGAVNWKFNAWGEKFHPYNRDVELGQRIIEHFDDIAVFEPEIILEGGAINCDGQGKLLTTRSAVLNANRNHEMSQEKMEKAFQKYLGIQDVIWLDQGLIEDLDTDGHIDNIACFVSPNQFLIQSYKEGDPNYSNYLKNYKTLHEFGDVVTVEAPTVNSNLPLSYLNFYLANQAVIVPAFGNNADEAAKGVIGDCFPDRTVKQINVLDIVIGGGGIHCITMQEPNACHPHVS